MMHFKSFNVVLTQEKKKLKSWNIFFFFFLSDSLTKHRCRVTGVSGTWWRFMSSCHIRKTDSTVTASSTTSQLCSILVCYFKAKYAVNQMYCVISHGLTSDGTEQAFKPTNSTCHLTLSSFFFFSLSGSEEEQWTMWGERLQWRVSVLSWEGCEGKSVSVL